MLVLLLDLYSLLNNKAISKEEIQAKLLKMIRHQLRKENLSLNDYYNNKKSELVESEKRLMEIDKELKSLKELENLDFEDIYFFGELQLVENNPCGQLPKPRKY